MKNCVHYTIQSVCPILLGCILLLTIVPKLTANNNDHNHNEASALMEPPEFIDPVPADTTIGCIIDLPAPVGLEATDDNDPNFPMTIFPTDDPDPMTIDACVGGTITRTWTATDQDGMSTSVSQTITVLPDNTAPVVSLSEINDTVTCEMLDFALWINSIRLAVATNSTDDCSGIDNITDDAPASFNDPCATVTVTFDVLDNCGALTQWVATYTTLDTVAPVLTGVPADIILNCQDPIPAPPMVTAMDNCTNPLVPEFNEVNTQMLDGSCNEYEYTITRTWTVSDSCGNETIAEQVITVEDSGAPTFTVPGDVTISCDEDPLDLDLTGDVTDAMDNCDPDVSVFFTDVTESGSCPESFTIIRTWRARDTCGNVTGKIQTITIADNEAPTFDVPNDITIDCSLAGNPANTGEPTMVEDNCDPEPEITFSDLVIAGSCENDFSIRRTWKVTDACGNFTELDQMIEVVDENAPTFSLQAQDLTITCTDGLDAEQPFMNWVNNRGGALASDNCSAGGDLTWTAVNEGTNTPASLPAIVCPSPSNVLTSQTVDFIVEDECGNRDTTTATFALRDILPPVLLNCPTDQTIGTDPGVCNASFTLTPPAIIEECSSSFSPVNASEILTMTSQAAPGEEGETPVDPLVFNLVLNHPLPINAFSDGTLLIELTDADAEGNTEYFNVIGEDGSLLGQTALSNDQCASSDTTLNLTVEQINAWASDGIITIRLEPNIPAGLPGRFAVNDICPGASTARLDLTFDASDLLNLTYEYRINDMPRVVVSPIMEVSTTLEPGENQITYYATDCAGNIDSCVYTVTVTDQEPPVVTCPSDITVSAEAGVCTAELTVPLVIGATDNCAVGEPQLLTMPADTGSAYWQFEENPNLNDYVAQEKIFTYTGLAANANGIVDLTLDFQGDFNTDEAILLIYGDDGNLLGNTTVGDADCNTPGQVTFSIMADLFNTWAADGEVQIRVAPKEIQVPPGLPGDGINPCNPALVNADGDVDSTSYLFVTLSYQTFTPSYFATGATEIPLTTVQAPMIAPSHTFNVGETFFSYILADANGNADTCTFSIIVEDNELPTPLCQPTTVFINPSGLDMETVPANVIDAGSFDNCEITSMTLSPNTFNCNQVGSTISATLTIMDAAGNQASCDTLIRIESAGPEPTANSGLCGGDTLFLFPNPPEATGGIVYTYQWAGPDNFTSQQKNPVITNIDADNAGTYSVTITGVTGCTAVGSVQVAIEDLPLTPEIITDSGVCNFEDIVLTSSIFPSGSNVTFRWYEGQPSTGTLINTTSLPSLTIPAPHLPGPKMYYVTVEADGCLSPPSQVRTVTVTAKPEAAVSFSDTTVCAGTTINLSAEMTGPGLTYIWDTPDGETLQGQFPEIGPLTNLDGGFYSLRTSRNGCESDPVTVEVTILPKPATPVIFNNGPVCEGEQIVLSTTLQGATTYHWIPVNNPMNGAVVTTTNSLNIPNADQGDNGQWYVYAMQFGCRSDNSNLTQIVVNAVPDAGVDATDATICEGETLELFATPDVDTYSYDWTGPSPNPAGFTSSLANPVVTNVAQGNGGTYAVTITTPAGCISTASIEVDILESVTLNGVTNNAPNCLDGATDVQLFANVFPPDDGSYEYEWRKEGVGLIGTDSVATIPNASEDNNGTYTVVVYTADGCASELGETIIDSRDKPETPAVPQIGDGLTPPFCKDEMYRVITTSVYTGTDITYYWNLPNAQNLPTSQPMFDIITADFENAGSYSVYVVVDGCASDESAGILIDVEPIPDITASSNSPVCRGELLQLQTEFFPGANYSWNGPNGFTSTTNNPVLNTNNPEVAGGAYFIATELNGCTSDTVRVDVVIDDLPSMPILENDGPICLGDPFASLTLSVDSASAIDGATYVWYDENMMPISEELSELEFEMTNFEDYTTDGTFNFYVRSKVGNCFSEFSAPSPVTFNTVPTNQAFAGDNASVCAGETLNMAGEMPQSGTGTWTANPSNPAMVDITNPNLATTAVSGFTEPGTYILQWTLSNGACANYDSDEVVITVTEELPPSAGEDFKVCITDEVQLNAIPPIDVNSTGMWSQPEAQELLGIIIENPSDPNTFVMGLEDDNIYSFTWTVTSGCGEQSDQVLVSVSDPSPEAGEETVWCNDEATGTLEADAPTLGSAGVWNSPDPDIIIDAPQSPVTDVRNLKEGENMFIWTIDDAFCGNRSRDTVVLFYKMISGAENDQVNVAFQEETPINVTLNDFVPPGSEISIIDGPEQGSVEMTGDGEFTYTPPFNFVGTDQLTYIISSEGCEDAEATVTFNIGEDAACKIPSIITPNNDGVNDLFVVPCLLDRDQFPSSQVLIFNRWGDEVFRSAIPYENDWNGTFDGEPLPAGTYFYIIDFGPDAEQQSGFVIIQR